MERITSSRAYRITYIGVPLIVAGLVVQERDRGFRHLRNDYVPSFRLHYDDYLQYAPAALMLGLKIGGVRGRSSWGRMLVSDAFSVALMAGAVNSLKYTCRMPRPDGSNNKSFPSGHTATAFMAATMLHKEYGPRSPWYSIAGYSMATVTGVSRMLNNKHWFSDVLVGAGIGILSVELGYLFADLIFKERGLTEFEQDFAFDRYCRPSFLGMEVSTDVVIGRYRPVAGVEGEFNAGVNLGIEGAWFMNPYVGFGGRTAVSSVPIKLNVAESTDRLDSWAASAGAYFSYPITAGLEYRRDNSEGTRLKKKGTPVAGGSAYNAYDEAAINYTAVYVQDEFKPDEKWLIIPSVRYDYSDKFGSEITSRLATTYNAAKDIRVKAVIGQGYKTPTVNELYHFWEMYAANPGGSGQFFEGNPDLQPEKSLSYELAVEKDWGDKTTAHLGIFRNDVKDLISSYWTGRFTDDDPNSYPGLGRDQVMTYRNVPKATLQGVEFYGSHELGKNIFMNFGYTYLEAKDKTGGTRLTDRAKHQLTFGVSYQPQNIYAWDCSFDIVSNLNYYYHNADKSTMGNSVYSTKNFTIANIMASKHLTKDAKIYLGIDNISNHRNFGAYADGNLGRLYRVGMEYKF